MHRILLVLILLLAGANPPQYSGDTSSAASLYYITAPSATVYATPDETTPYVRLQRREQVYLIDREGGWARVRTKDGAEGYLLSGSLSNVWIRISKESQTLFVYRGSELWKKFSVDLGHNYFADKERRGSVADRDHWRTPDGQFFVVNKNGRSQYHKAFVLNYPNGEDAEFGLRKGLISEAEHEAILNAEKDAAMPPMDTALGGWIEIHGNGTGARSNWTKGCIALRDTEIDALWALVPVGAPVLIEP